MSSLQLELATKVSGVLTLKPTPRAKKAPIPTRPDPQKIEASIFKADRTIISVKGKDNISRDMAGILLKETEEGAINWLQQEGHKRFAVLVLGIIGEKSSFWQIRTGPAIPVNKILGRLRKRECSVRKVSLNPEQHRQILDLRPMKQKGPSSWNYEPALQIILSSRVREERPLLTYQNILEAVQYELLNIS